MNKTLGDHSMTWKICCNNIGQNRTTFQSFLNVLKIREMSGKEVNEKGKSFYDTDLYGQGLLKYIGRYKVLKEQRIEEKIEFVKQNFPPGTCSEVKKQ